MRPVSASDPARSLTQLGDPAPSGPARADVVDGVPLRDLASAATSRAVTGQVAPFMGPPTVPLPALNADLRNGAESFAFHMDRVMADIGSAAPGPSGAAELEGTDMVAAFLKLNIEDPSNTVETLTKLDQLASAIRVGKIGSDHALWTALLDGAGGGEATNGGEAGAGGVASGMGTGVAGAVADACNSPVGQAAQAVSVAAMAVCAIADSVVAAEVGENTDSVDAANGVAPAAADSATDGAAAACGDGATGGSCGGGDGGDGGW
jgi:hypothetical protein